MSGAWATSSPLPLNSMPVGLCRPRANVLQVSATPSPSVSSRMRILSSIGSVGFQCGYVCHTATHSRPLASQAICTGLTSSGNFSSLANRLTFSPLPGVMALMESGPLRNRCLPPGPAPGLLVVTGTKAGMLESSGLSACPFAAAQMTLSRLATITSSTSSSRCTTS